MEENKLIRVAITQGDTNGIGCEVILKALDDPTFTELCTPIIYASQKVFSTHRKALNLPALPLNFVADATEAGKGKINFINISDNDIKVDFGHNSKHAGVAAFNSLEAALADVKTNRADVLVTAPISKENIRSDQFPFPGHTEYLEASVSEPGQALMMMCAGNLRVALATTHLPIAKVPESITTELIVGKVRILDASLRRDFAIERPRIAVLALNPHAGENGLLGHEEADIIAPAIEQCRNDYNIVCFGPYPADGFFGTDRYRHFDAVLAMYHDQGMAPFKALAMDSGVNFTAGLPVVRTSPDHGTGYDIAGKGVAKPDSMRQAIYLAIDICRNRQRYDEARANPMQRQYVERGRDNVVLDLTQDE